MENATTIEQKHNFVFSKNNKELVVFRVVKNKKERVI